MGVEVLPSLQGCMLQGDGVFKRKASTDVFSCRGLKTSSPVYMQGTQSCGSTICQQRSPQHFPQIHSPPPSIRPGVPCRPGGLFSESISLRSLGRPVRPDIVFRWKLSKIRAQSHHGQCVYLVSQTHFQCGALLPDHADGLKRFGHAEPPALVQDAP